MITTAHLASGAIIGTVIPDPILICIISFLFHYLLDFVPHKAASPLDMVKAHGVRGLRHHPKKEIFFKTIEPLFANLIAWLYFALSPTDLRLNIFLGAFFGWLPDLLVYLEWRYGIPRPWPFGYLERRYHQHRKDVWGQLPQIAFIVACLTIMVNYIT